MSEPDTTAFAIGDVVRLRSGGPLLTVTKCQGPGCSVCWFAGDSLRSDWFNALVLERAETGAESAAQEGR